MRRCRSARPEAAEPPAPSGRVGPGHEGEGGTGAGGRRRCGRAGGRGAGSGGRQPREEPQRAGAQGAGQPALRRPQVPRGRCRLWPRHRECLPGLGLPAFSRHPALPCPDLPGPVLPNDAHLSGALSSPTPLLPCSGPCRRPPPPGCLSAQGPVPSQTSPFSGPCHYLLSPCPGPCPPTAQYPPPQGPVCLPPLPPSVPSLEPCPLPEVPVLRAMSLPRSPAHGPVPTAVPRPAPGGCKAVGPKALGPGYPPHLPMGLQLPTCPLPAQQGGGIPRPGDSTPLSHARRFVTWLLPMAPPWAGR